MSQTIKETLGWKMVWCALLRPWRPHRRWRSVEGRIRKQVVSVARLGPLKVITDFMTLITSSMPTPSPGSPAFFKMGRGRKIFFSIMLMTKSRWGMMTVDMQLGSASRSLNYWRYPCLSAFSLMCLESSLRSSGDEHAWSFFKNWSLK